MAIEGGGKRLDRFELVAELATGGMATVYLARLSGVGGFQRFTAIKRLHPHLAREPEFIEMFLEEARLAARIHHPNVVPILEIGTSDEGYYIVMEYVEGDTLGRLLARSAQTGSRLPTKVGLRIIIDMLAGLEAAHELKDDDGHALGIVHRDISPQNVLVGVDGSSRLSDFGVARATSQVSTTRTGQLKGKLAYMAPEQAKGSRDIDHRTDIFAAGIVLWEVLACRRLFKGDGEADTLNRIINEPIPTLRSAAPMVPAALEAVVARALERDRSKRYSTAAEFADALERASRVVGVLGTHKDVASHLEAVLGTEISQQREAVRAWLARSEPSRHGHEPTQAESTSVTKVEGRDGGSAPRVDRGSGSLPRVPAETNGSGSAGSHPSGVSSVSSVTAAVNPKAAPASSDFPLLEPVPEGGRPAVRRARVWPWATVAAVGILASAGWVTVHRLPRGAHASALPGPTASSPAPPQPDPPSTGSVTVPDARAIVTTPAASAIPGPSVASAVSPAPRHPQGPARATHPIVIPTVAPTPAAPASDPPSAVVPAPAAGPSAVPDDISRNPYR